MPSLDGQKNDEEREEQKIPVKDAPPDKLKEADKPPQIKVTSQPDPDDPYADIEPDQPPAKAPHKGPDPEDLAYGPPEPLPYRSFTHLEALKQEDDSQDNFVEAKDPTELAMCFILASAYLGLAKYCWVPLLLARNWKLLVNVEGFFVTIALLAVLVGLRPYLSPSNLQLSSKGIKYKGPYWPQRKTVNWGQVFRAYVSPELIVVLYRPKMTSKRIWLLLISCIYLADREKLAKSFLKHCPTPPVIMTSPALLSRALIVFLFLATVIWLFEMLMAPA